MNKYLTKIAGLHGLEPATLKAAVGLGSLAVSGGVLKSHLKNRSDERRQARTDSVSVARTMVGRLSAEDAAKRIAIPAKKTD